MLASLRTDLASHRAGLEHRDAHAAPGERDAGRHAGVTSADDGNLSGYVVTHVFQAIQSLRSGVSEVRWVSTLKPSRSISSSRVR